LAFAVLGVLMTSNTAYAAAGYCVAPSNPITTDGLALSGVTFNFNNADQCYGFQAAASATVFDGATYGTGTWLTAENAGLGGNKTIGIDVGLALTFVLTPLQNGTNGTCSLFFAAPNGAGPSPSFPRTYDIVLALQDSTSGSKWA